MIVASQAPKPCRFFVFGPKPYAKHPCVFGSGSSWMIFCRAKGHPHKRQDGYLHGWVYCPSFTKRIVPKGSTVLVSSDGAIKAVIGRKSHSFWHVGFCCLLFQHDPAAVRSKLQTTRIGSFSIKSGGKLVSYHPPTKSTAWKGLRMVLVRKIFWNLANMQLDCFFVCSGQWQLQTCAPSWCALAAYWDCASMTFPLLGLMSASVMPCAFGRCLLSQTCATTRALQA